MHIPAIIEGAVPKNATISFAGFWIISDHAG
jgi:hypothetical protein